LRDLTLGFLTLGYLALGYLALGYLASVCLAESMVFIGWYLPNGPYRLAWHLRKITLPS
jgi:hypothetical protein